MIKKYQKRKIFENDLKKNPNLKMKIEKVSVSPLSGTPKLF